MTTKPFSKHNIAALLLCFAAFFMSALVSRTVFERLPHLEDEVAYLYQARLYAGGNLVIDTPEPRRAYWMPFLLDQGGNRFGKYTPGWSMQLSLGTLMGQEWVINAFLAALTVALVYRLGREIFNRDVGLIAAALTTFSPMVLLLAGTLMGHTAAMFAATLFLYAYWRLERARRHNLLWGALAGIGLGLLVANRPITGIAFAAPLILWSGLRLLRALVRQFRPAALEVGQPPSLDPAVTTMEVALKPPSHDLPFAPVDNAPVRGFWATLQPLLALSVFTVMLALIVPLNNYLAVGSPTKDLYTLVWSYDTVGFGQCCGRSGHTLEKGIRQARFDLSLTAADMFGWQIGSLTDENGTLKPEVQNHILNEGDYWEQLGLSWVLLPFAFVVAYRRKAVFIAIWVVAAFFWVRFALYFQGGAQLTNPVFAWLWILGSLAWLYLPLLFWRDRQRAWTWILWSAAIGLVIFQMTYWIGSQRYSTRYFFEGLSSIAIISALPVAWLARRISRPVIYGLLALAIAYGLYFYSTPRIGALRGFNFIDQRQIEAVEARRTGDQPVLVLINGASVRWRAYGSLMGVTNPYLNSDIVVAWNYEGIDGTVKQRILDRFPGYQVIEMEAQDNYWWFTDQMPPTDTTSGGGPAPQLPTDAVG
jgi:4-amino-4-deoxy-L-arabinose transferase-like glycosyltransferase